MSDKKGETLDQREGAFIVSQVSKWPIETFEQGEGAFIVSLVSKWTIETLEQGEGALIVSQVSNWSIETLDQGDGTLIVSQVSKWPIHQTGQQGKLSAKTVFRYKTKTKCSTAVFETTVLASLDSSFHFFHFKNKHPLPVRAVYLANHCFLYTSFPHFSLFGLHFAGTDSPEISYMTYDC